MMHKQYTRLVLYLTFESTVDVELCENNSERINFSSYFDKKKGDNWVETIFGGVGVDSQTICTDSDYENYYNCVSKIYLQFMTDNDCPWSFFFFYKLL